MAKKICITSCCCFGQIATRFAAKQGVMLLSESNMIKLVVLPVFLLILSCQSSMSLKEKQIVQATKKDFVDLEISNNTLGSGINCNEEVYSESCQIDYAIEYDWAKSYILKNFEGSGLFYIAKRSEPDSVISVQYDRVKDDSVGEYLLQLLSIATLFIVPAEVDYNYKIEIKISGNDGNALDACYENVAKEVTGLSEIIKIGSTDGASLRDFDREAISRTLNNFFSDYSKYKQTGKFPDAQCL